MEDRKHKKKGIENPYNISDKPLIEISIGEYYNPYDDKNDRPKNMKRRNMFGY